MRKEYSHPLRKQFSAMMAEAHPNFKEIKVKTIYFNPGDRAYEWKLSDGRTCYVILVFHSHGDNLFTIEIGWSKHGRFPELSMRPCIESPDEKGVLNAEEYVCLLQSLTKVYGEERDFWRVGKGLPVTDEEFFKSLEPIPEDVAELEAKNALKDVFPLVSEYGIPFLEKYANV